MIKITVAHEISDAQYQAIQRDVELYIERDINSAEADVMFSRDNHTTVDCPDTNIAASIANVVRRAIEKAQS